MKRPADNPPALTKTPKAGCFPVYVRSGLQKLRRRHRVIGEIFKACLAPVTGRFADASFVITEDDKPAPGEEVPTPIHLAHCWATAMGKHDGSSTFCLRFGDHQRTRERDITVFESYFFLADRNSSRERSGLAIGLAALKIQIDYVSSCAAKANCLPGRRRHIKGRSAGELSL